MACCQPSVIQLPFPALQDRGAPWTVRMAFSWGFVLGSETLVVVSRVAETVENCRKVVLSLVSVENLSASVIEQGPRGMQGKFEFIATVKEPC